MFKKRYLLLGAAIPFVMLNGCAIGQNSEDKSVPIVKVDMSRYEKKTLEGEFKGLLNEKFIDINVDGKLRTYFVQDSAQKYLKGLKVGDTVSFVAGINEKTNQNEVYSVAEINGKLLSVDSPAKNTLELKTKKDEGEKVNIEVDYPKTTKVIKAIESDFFDGKFKVIDTYEWNGETLSNDETEIKITEIEDTPEDDVQKERWRAASLLKDDFGDFKEIKDEDREGLKFIFYGEDEDKYQEISVVKNKFGYFRVEVSTSVDIKENVKSEITAMLNSIK